MQFFNTRWKRFLAVALALMVVLGSVAAGLSMTYAAATYKERFEQPNGYDTVEVGRSKTVEGLSGVNAVRSSDTTKLEATKSGGAAVVEGKKAGVVGISVATKLYSASLAFQVTNSDQISGYDLLNNGEINKKSGDAAFSLNDYVNTYVTSWAQLSEKSKENSYQLDSSAKSKITWMSRNGDVADFNAAGLLVLKGKGVAVIIGSFEDRWGAARTFTILVGVDVVVGKSLLSDLADAIKRAESILALNPNPYEEAGLGTLQTAVNNGKTVLGSSDPADSAINTAINNIEKAIDDLVLKATTTDPDAPIVVPGTPDGDKQVKPVPGPENIYEVLDGNGNSKVPPEYIYDPGGSFKEDPPRWSGDEVPAYKDGYIYYAEELPLGSNIFTPIKEDGTRDYDNAVWGGANKRPGGGDDSKAVKDGSVWYAEDPAGSNLWKPVQTALLPNQGTLMDSGWKGGGADGLPSGNDNLFPIIEHDGAYYAGPFNDGTNDYYIGTGANGRFDTSGNGGVPVGHAAAKDDKKLYWNGTGTPGEGGDGDFDTDPPETGIPGLTETTDVGMILTIDGVKWVKIKEATLGYSKFALLVRYENYGDPVKWLETKFQSATYNNSTLQAAITDYYVNVFKTAQPTLYAATVLPELGVDSEATQHTAVSTPTINFAKDSEQVKDVCFPLSYKESMDSIWDGNDSEWWSRSYHGSTGTASYAWMVDRNGVPVYGNNQTVFSYGLRPAVWVMVAK